MKHGHLGYFTSFSVSQEHVTYEWKDTTEELHFSLAKLLRDKVVTLYQKFIKSQPEGLYTGRLFHCYMLDESICHFSAVRSILLPLFYA